MQPEIPIWLKPATLKSWPTRSLKRDDLGYLLPLPATWNREPQIITGRLETTHTYRGPNPLEHLAVNFIPQANPTHNMQNWVNSVIRTTGFPILEMTTLAYLNTISGLNAKITLNGEGLLKLLTWDYLGQCQALTKRLAVEETHLYCGLGQLKRPRPLLARLYVVLVRRGTFAWKVSLSFISACLPGAAEEVVASNDHVRAGAVLGHLIILD